MIFHSSMTNNLQSLEEKLATLRKRWLAEPNNRGVIELQAKVIKIGINNYINKHHNINDDKLIEAAEDIFKL